MTALAALTQVYVNSATTTSLTASVNTLYVIDTAHAGVTLTLPSGVAIGNWVVVINAPAGGFQMGGTAAGNGVTVAASGGETIEGNATFNRKAPTSLITAGTSKFWPAGAASGSTGFGAGWAVD